MILIGAKFQVSLSNVVLIGTKCLVFPQQRGFDWYEAKFYVSPSNAVRLMQLYFIWNWHRVIFYSCATLDLLTACLFKEIGLITVFGAILTSRQTGLKKQCLYGNPMSNNFDKTTLLKNS